MGGWHGSLYAVGDFSCMFLELAKILIFVSSDIWARIWLIKKQSWGTIVLSHKNGKACASNSKGGL